MSKWQQLVSQEDLVNLQPTLTEAGPPPAWSSEEARLLARRIDTLVRLQPVDDRRERPFHRENFRRVIERARAALLGGTANSISAALAEIDLLSLELCEE